MVGHEGDVHPEPPVDGLWFRDLAERAGYAFFRLQTQPTIRVEYLSRSVADLGGFEPEAYLQDPGLLLRTSDPRDVDTLLTALASPPGSEMALELRWTRVDGETIWLQHSGRFTERSDGSVVLDGTAHDVTDLRETQERLEAAEARYRLLAENSADFVALIVSPGTLEWLSPSVESELGWRPDDATGRALDSFVHPDDLQDLVDAAAATREGGSVASRSRLLAADGAYQWYDVTVRPVFGEDDVVLHYVAAFRNADAEVRATEALRASEERYRLLTENSMDVILHLRRGMVSWVSPSLEDALGWPPEEWIGRAMDAFLHPDDRLQFERNRAMLTAGKPVISRYRVVARDGGSHWIEMHAKPYLTTEDVQDGSVASFRTIDPEVHAEEELTRRARYDDLTGALKRDEILSRLGDVSSRRRTPGEECGVLFIDVDAFKNVNDTLGHATGDAVLAALAARVRDCIRSGDTIARMGGDEFLVILNDIHGIDEARAVAEKVRLAAARPIASSGVTAHVTVSVGVTLSHPVEGVDDVIARADEAMYEAKRAGRDRVAALP